MKKASSRLAWASSPWACASAPSSASAAAPPHGRGRRRLVGELADGPRGEGPEAAEGEAHPDDVHRPGLPHPHRVAPLGVDHAAGVGLRRPTRHLSPPRVAEVEHEVRLPIDENIDLELDGLRSGVHEPVAFNEAGERGGGRSEAVHAAGLNTPAGRRPGVPRRRWPWIAGLVGGDPAGLRLRAARQAGIVRAAR